MIIKKSKRKFDNIFFVLKHLGFLSILKLISSYLLTINHCYILNCNLKSIISFSLLRNPTGKLRKLESNDLKILKDCLNKLNYNDKKELLSRILFYQNGFDNCYIFLINGQIAYLQWLIYPSENTIIDKYYKKNYYPLRKNQIMIENAFTFPNFRGRGLFPFVTQSLLQIAKDQGYKSVVSYIKKNNIISLNEFIKMGFKITKIIGDYKLLGTAWRKLY